MKIINYSYSIFLLLSFFVIQVNGILFDLQTLSTKSIESIGNLNSNYSRMRNHDIVFNRDNNRVGFNKSNRTRMTATVDIPGRVIQKDNCINDYQSLFSIIYVVLLCIIVFLSTAIYYLRKGKQFLCFKKRYNIVYSQARQVIDDEIEKAIGVKT